MSLQRTVIQMLDRPGGRSLLSFLATRYARAKLGCDCAVFYDGAWFHRIKDAVIADDARFNYFADTPRFWEPNFRAQCEESRDSWFLHYKPKPGDTIIDIGAGVGIDTIVFSQAVGPTGTVYAIEAHPETHRRLQRTCHYNRLDNVRPFHNAITNRPGPVYISNNDDHQSNKVDTAPQSGGVSTPVEGLSLDAFCDRHGIQQIDLLKVNIEGAERWLVEGMTETLRRTRYVAIACHDFLGDDDPSMRTRETVIQALDAAGFEVRPRDEDPRPPIQCHVHAWPRNASAAGARTGP